MCLTPWLEISNCKTLARSLTHKSDRYPLRKLIQLFFSAVKNNVTPSGFSPSIHPEITIITSLWDYIQKVFLSAFPLKFQEEKNITKPKF